MAIKKEKTRVLKRVVVACFLVVITFFGVIASVFGNQSFVYADEPESEESTTESENRSNAAENARFSSSQDSSNNSGQTTQNSSSVSMISGDVDTQCKKSFEAIGWLVCPATGKIAEAVDFLYGTIENLLIVKPIKIEDGTPIYEIWKYCRGLTNLVFIIMLLMVIYSQITGLGVSNHGIKRALPRLIVAAVLVNLSFIICSILVDISNIAGNGLRGLFSTIAESAVSTNPALTTSVSAVELLGVLAAGGVFAGVTLALNPGALYMLVPMLLGMLVSILTGVFTIALRQAAVALLVMIAPLAIVANILPNTENLFRRWKTILIQMLVFYPMFSLLFGASNLAGFAIIASSDNVFGVLLGVTVQVFPLIFSWKLMQMSNTVLGGISFWARGLADGPLMATREWAMSHMIHKRQKTIATGNPYRPSVALLQFMDRRRHQREIETGENIDYIRERAMAQHARSHYRKDGTVSRRGERAYSMQADRMSYQYEVMRDKDNFDKGLGDMGRGGAQTERLRRLDVKNVKAAGDLQAEIVRGERIRFDNAVSYFKRLDDARSAHLDEEHGYEEDPATGQRVPKKGWKFKFEAGSPEQIEALARYNRVFQIMDNDLAGVEQVTAAAVQGYAARQTVLARQMYGDFKNIPEQQYLRSTIEDLCTQPNAAQFLDSILPGFRVLSEYKDFSVIISRIKDIARHDEQHSGLVLGTHASQSLANFLMFEVGDRDPFLRKFGNYVNQETVRLYDPNDQRINEHVNYDEYLLGYYYEPDPNNPGKTRKVLSKKSISEFLKGMKFDSIEGAAFDSYEASLRDAFTSVDEDGNKVFDVSGYLKRKEEIEDAIGEELITAEMKYASGSDQLSGSVRLKTGFITKRNPDTGKPYVVPIWEDPETLKKYGMVGHEEELRDYYQRRLIKSVKAMSPKQILATRSAYREPLLMHLSDAYIDSSTEGWTDEEKEERAGLLERLTAAEEEYNRRPVGYEKTQAMLDIQALRSDMAGLFFRRILSESGTLEQIYATRGSGAANNAKGFLRDLLSLDDPREIKRVINNHRQAKKSGRADLSVDDDGSYQPSGTYTIEDIMDFKTRMEILRDDTVTEPVEKFYETLRDCARSQYSDFAERALNELKQYYDENRISIKKQDLIDKLIELLAEDLLDDNSSE